MNYTVVKNETIILNYKALRTFIKVAELGSFTQAAQYLKQPKSRVSRAVQKLESELGVQLLRRTTRKTQLTQAGRQLLQDVRPLLLQLDTALENAVALEQEVVGVLKITAPEDLGVRVLGPLISKFSVLHPSLQFELLLENRFVDMLAENVDLALRFGHLNESNLIQRKLTDVQMVLVASPEYVVLHGLPSDLNALDSHALLLFKNNNLSAAYRPHFIESHAQNPLIASNQFALLLEMALMGQGIATLPDFYAKPFLAQRQLVRVLPALESHKSPLHLLYPPIRPMPLRMRHFIDFMLENIGEYLGT